jgi:hypothetical protein
MDQQIGGILKEREGAPLKYQDSFVLPKTHRIEGRFAPLLWSTVS